MLKNKIPFLVLICFIFTLQSCATQKQISYKTENIQPFVLNKKPIRVALVLGGGGAKGMAHLGVISALEKYNIPIDLIVGTSSGAIIGALYAQNPSQETIKDELFKVKRSDLIDVTLIQPSFERPFISLAAGAKIQGYFVKQFKEQTFADLKIPMVAVSVNLKTNEAYPINNGPIVPAILASASLPPVYSPISIYGAELTDGGAILPVPVAIAKLFNPQIIIAVNVASKPLTSSDANFIYLSYKAMNLAYYELTKMQTEQADVGIYPDLSNFGIFDDHNKMDVYMAGVKAVEKKIPVILHKLSELKK